MILMRVSDGVMKADLWSESMRVYLLEYPDHKNSLTDVYVLDVERTTGIAGFSSCCKRRMARVRS